MVQGVGVDKRTRFPLPFIPSHQGRGDFLFRSFLFWIFVVISNFTCSSNEFFGKLGFHISNSNPERSRIKRGQ